MGSEDVEDANACVGRMGVFDVEVRRMEACPDVAERGAEIGAGVVR